MANAEIVGYLQLYGQSGEIGAIEVSHESMGGRIFLQAGMIVHAETVGAGGLLAFFLLMIREQISASWQAGLMPEVFTMKEPVDTLLFQFAQLEDAGLANEESIRERFGQHASSVPMRKRRDFSKAEVFLQGLNAGFADQQFVLMKGNNLVGKSPDCTIVIPQATVSSRHCQLVLDHDSLRVVDLGSTNGTFLNEEVVSDAYVEVEDILRLGEVSFRVAMRIKRNLSLAGDSASPAAGSPAVSGSAIPQRARPTGAAPRTQVIQGPIHWKNVNSIAAKPAGKAKPSSSSVNGNKSLLGRLFKK